jgi:hypothetical protein
LRGALGRWGVRRLADCTAYRKRKRKFEGVRYEREKIELEQAIIE